MRSANQRLTENLTTSPPIFKKGLGKVPDTGTAKGFPGTGGEVVRGGEVPQSVNSNVQNFTNWEFFTHMVKKRFTFGVNERGNPLGEAHRNANLTDAQVEAIRDEYDEGKTSYRKLAEKYSVTKACVQGIIQFRRRACTPASYRTAIIEVEANFAIRPDWFRVRFDFDKK